MFLLWVSFAFFFFHVSVVFGLPASTAEQSSHHEMNKDLLDTAGHGKYYMLFFKVSILRVSDLTTIFGLPENVQFDTTIFKP